MVRLPCGGGRITAGSDPHGTVAEQKRKWLDRCRDQIENGNKVYMIEVQSLDVYLAQTVIRSVISKKKSLKHGVAIGSLLLNRQLGSSSSAYA